MQMAGGTLVLAALMLTGTAVAQGLNAPTDEFPTPGGQYESQVGGIRYPNAAVSGTVDIELVALSLKSPNPVNTLTLLNRGNGEFPVESFFDVFVEMSVDGGGASIDSFFDVFTELSVDGGSDAMTGLFDAEIVSMSLSSSAPQPFPISIPNEPNTLMRLTRATGPVEISDIGGGLYHIDSFFDVFTELSVDGGNSWIAGSGGPLGNGGMRVTLIPEPAALSLLGLGALALYRRRK
jgi:hypothetical protein